MKLKIVEKGMENYSGYFGQIEFKDGVSVRDVTIVESNLISALVRINWIDGEKDIGRAEITSVAFDKVAEVAPDRSVTPEEPKAEQKKGQKYSREDLEAVADSKGLNGLREIGAQFGVKSTSINKLIEAILEAQK